MRKLKICLVSLTIAPDSQDGSAKFFRGIFDYLRNHGHEITLLTGKWNIKLKDPNIHQINLIKKSFFWIPQFTVKIIKYLKNHDFDIIHGNGPKGSLPLLLNHNNEFISTIHDLGPLESKFSLIPIEKYLLKKVAKRAKFLTTCSDFIKNEIKRSIPNVDIKNIYNLYSAIEKKFKPYPQEAQKLKETLGIQGPILLYIGRIALYKGVHHIISAYKIAKKQIPDLNLVIGGTPDFYMEKYYKSWIQKYKDIHFVGFISDQMIPIYYSMGDIFLNYSYANEGFGLTPLEAIACGTPIICSSLIPYKEVLKDNAMFVHPHKPKLLAREIINLLKDETKRKFMVEKAQLFIKRYTWDAVGKKLEKVYKEFLEN
ncbi:MAG: glycosyltransferase family 4 protein [Promethearchaeota archaeon]